MTVERLSIEGPVEVAIRLLPNALGRLLGITPRFARNLENSSDLVLQSDTAMGFSAEAARVSGLSVPSCYDPRNGETGIPFLTHDEDYTN